ncbi:hypothetical protein Phum_PHUM496030 [Pediculus humanus corporis]|uniref:Uncharacterized protein n=1 Tax=Pediculus humanus subsp. corporis TaxID=121224 RepID=E0VX69_PEDHC|nr:uncharacterized protein Phum_PHUM496030 [Pediculus humanus corporis]EEB17975.1 hypothetical protein Phum_PHUM496030 [Pediculus humanus corporis]
MTRGPSVESTTETSEDLSIRRRRRGQQRVSSSSSSQQGGGGLPQDLTIVKLKEEEEENKREFYKKEDDGRDDVKDERNGKIISDRTKRKSDEENGNGNDDNDDDENVGNGEKKLKTDVVVVVNRTNENSLPATDLTEKRLSLRNAMPMTTTTTPSMPSTFRNPDDYDVSTRLRSSSNGNHVDLLSKTLIRGIPKELKVKEPGRGVWAREKIPKGTRYGPFFGKWVSDPIDGRYAWEGYE